MPRKDFYHDVVKRAVVKDGWTITHDPIYLPFLDTFLQVDIGAERFEIKRGTVKIAVEVKNFREPGAYANELHKAVGQVQMYMEILSKIEPDRDTYLAVTEEAFASVFSKSLLQGFIKRLGIKLVVFNPTSETIIKWDA